jgi:hypothetical protein
MLQKDLQASKTLIIECKSKMPKVIKLNDTGFTYQLFFISGPYATFHGMAI